MRRKVIAAIIAAAALLGGAAAASAASGGAVRARSLERAQLRPAGRQDGTLDLPADARQPGPRGRLS